MKHMWQYSDIPFLGNAGFSAVGMVTLSKRYHRYWKPPCLFCSLVEAHYWPELDSIGFHWMCWNPKIGQKSTTIDVIKMTCDVFPFLDFFWILNRPKKIQKNPVVFRVTLEIHWTLGFLIGLSKTNENRPKQECRTPVGVGFDYFIY